MHATVQVRSHTRKMLVLFAAYVLVGAAHAAEPALEAPNVVIISSTLVTSGQPTAKALSQLAAQGFAAVIYLAPPTVSDAIPGEAEIVRKQGLEFINIPIKFGEPTEADVDAFIAAMNRLRERKVLVHCQINMRASTMTFLYRVVVGHEKPELAYESVARIWSPNGPWKGLLVSQLRKASIQFEPY
ncbi:MAG: protein tyrosine phosphatase family protein [Pseudomonadota bacterium]